MKILVRGISEMTLVGPGTGNYQRGDGVTTCRECGVSLEKIREGCPSCILRMIEKQALNGDRS